MTFPRIDLIRFILMSLWSGLDKVPPCWFRQACLQDVTKMVQ